MIILNENSNNWDFTGKLHFNCEANIKIKSQMLEFSFKIILTLVNNAINLQHFPANAMLQLI